MNENMSVFEKKEYDDNLKNKLDDFLFKVVPFLPEADKDKLIEEIFFHSVEDGIRCLKILGINREKGRKFIFSKNLIEAHADVFEYFLKGLKQAYYYEWARGVSEDEIPDEKELNDLECMMKDAKYRSIYKERPGFFEDSKSEKVLDAIEDYYASLLRDKELSPLDVSAENKEDLFLEKLSYQHQKPIYIEDFFRKLENYTNNSRKELERKISENKELESLLEKIKYSDHIGLIEAKNLANFFEISMTESELESMRYKHLDVVFNMQKNKILPKIKQRIEQKIKPLGGKLNFDELSKQYVLELSEENTQKETIMYDYCFDVPDQIPTETLRQSGDGFGYFRDDFTSHLEMYTSGFIRESRFLHSFDLQSIPTLQPKEVKTSSIDSLSENSKKDERFDEQRKLSLLQSFRGDRLIEWKDGIPYDKESGYEIFYAKNIGCRKDLFKSCNCIFDLDGNYYLSPEGIHEQDGVWFGARLDSKDESKSEICNVETGEVLMSVSTGVLFNKTNNGLLVYTRNSDKVVSIIKESKIVGQLGVSNKFPEILNVCDREYIVIERGGKRLFFENNKQLFPEKVISSVKELGTEVVVCFEDGSVRFLSGNPLPNFLQKISDGAQKEKNGVGNDILIENNYFGDDNFYLVTDQKNGVMDYYDTNWNKIVSYLDLRGMWQFDDYRIVQKSDNKVYVISIKNNQLQEFEIPDLCWKDVCSHFDHRMNFPLSRKTNSGFVIGALNTQKRQLWVKEFVHAEAQNKSELDGLRLFLEKELEKLNIINSNDVDAAHLLMNLEKEEVSLVDATRKRLNSSRSFARTMTKVITENPREFVRSLRGKASPDMDLLMHNVADYLFLKNKKDLNCGDSKFSRKVGFHGGQANLSGGKESMEDVEILSTNKNINGFMRSNIAGKYDRESNSWENIVFPINNGEGISGEKTEIIIPIKPDQREVSLPFVMGSYIDEKSIEATLKKKSILDMFRKNKVDMTIERDISGAVSVVLPAVGELKGRLESIKYVQIKPEIQSVPRNISADEYKKVKEDFEEEYGNNLPKNLFNIGTEFEFFLQDIKKMAPIEKVKAIELEVQRVGYYHHVSPKKRDRMNEVDYDTRVNMMQCEMDDIQSSKKEVGKKYAGICADFALLTTELLRRAGFVTGIMNGPLMQNQKTVTSNDMHGLSYVVWPAAIGRGYEIYPVDGTPSGASNRIIDNPSFQKIIEQKFELNESIEINTAEVSYELDLLHDLSKEDLELVGANKIHLIERQLSVAGKLKRDISRMQSLFNVALYAGMKLDEVMDKKRGDNRFFSDIINNDDAITNDFDGAVSFFKEYSQRFDRNNDKMIELLEHFKNEFSPEMLSFSKIILKHLDQ